MGISSFFTVALAATASLLSGVQAGTIENEKRTLYSGHWVDTWTSMPQLTEPANLPPAPFNQSGLVFPNSTIRQTLHMTIGGDQIRIRLSNAFGGSDLPITAVSVALPFNGSAGVSAIQPNTVTPVTFSGNSSITIPNGALAVSDPIKFPIKPQQNIAVTIYLATGQTTNSITSHPGSRTTSWFSFGNYLNAANLTANGTTSAAASVAHWYFLSAVEVWAPLTSRAMAVVGDSITDGRGSTTDANNRWPDLLYARMAKTPYVANIGVVNQAAGGNRILADGLGPNALGRIDRDVLAQSGIKYAMIFEGVNDIGTANTTAEAQQAVGDRLIQAFKQMVVRIHTFGIPVFAATITPFSGANSTIQPYSVPIREATRQRVNDFIRNSGIFDAVVDFDAILRNQSVPSQLATAYDSGDYLHPNVAGYQRLADQFPLEIFNQYAFGVNGYQ